MEEIRKVYSALVNFLQLPSYTGENQSLDFNFEKFVRHFKLDSLKSHFSLKALEQDGWFDLNEKSFTASSILFTATKTELEEFEKAHPEHEPLLTMILRNYEGVFDYPAFISEFILARLLHRQEEEIKQELRTIAFFGMIRYTLQNESPQIAFRKHRVPSSELEFKWGPYNRRKNLFVERVTAMINYSRATECRSKFISDYFGQKDAAACGTCDNCIQKNAGTVSAEEFEKISAIITRTLTGTNLTMPQLLEKIGKVRKEKAWKVIEFLQSEEKISADKSGLLYLK
jgi:ATP-dependent DNA helicase RecQ